jgi:diguanylate cyclase (GGDEF)-like protein
MIDDRDATLHLPAFVATAIQGAGVELLTASLLSDMGIQLWNAKGRAFFLNTSTGNHFGLDITAPDLSWQSFARLCLNGRGESVSSDQFPISVVLNTGKPSPEITVQIIGVTKKRRWLRISAQPLKHPETGALIVFSTSIDVTESYNEKERLQYQACHDFITRLPNRVLLFDRLRQAILRSRRTNSMLALCLIDLDGFKQVNDLHGHTVGDGLLVEIAHRLRSLVREEDTLARLGGDEFVLLMEALHNTAQCEQALRRIFHEIARPFCIGESEISITLSIGVSFFPGDVDDPDGLLRHADAAMYRAKEKGRNRSEIYDPMADFRVRANRGVITQIVKAIDNQELRLVYQPKVDCRRGEVVGFETLVRWEHPILGMRMPAEFLPLIEHDDAIVRLGEWVIVEALEQMSKWRKIGVELSVSVNISARGFLQGGFDNRLENLLKRYPPELVTALELEMVETGILGDVQLLGNLVNRLQSFGISFALDDFGTGYSSLLHLKRLGPDTLKIDKSFIRDMLDDPGDLAIVKAVIGMGKALRHRVVAEGVETIDQLLMLLNLGCDVMQGFYLARPMEPDRVIEWFKAFRPDPRWRSG